MTVPEIWKTKLEMLGLVALVIAFVALMVAVGNDHDKYEFAGAPEPLALYHGDTFTVVSQPEQIPNTNLALVTIERSSDKYHLTALMSLPYVVPVGTKVVPRQKEYRFAYGAPLSKIIYLENSKAERF